MSVTISIWNSIKRFIQAHINLSRLTFVSRLPQLLYFKSAERHFFSVGWKRFSPDLAVLWSCYEVILNSSVTKKKENKKPTNIYLEHFYISLISSCLTSWRKFFASLFLPRSCYKLRQIAVSGILHFRNTSSQKQRRKGPQLHLPLQGKHALSTARHLSNLQPCTSHEGRCMSPSSSLVQCLMMLIIRKFS